MGQSIINNYSGTDNQRKLRLKVEEITKLSTIPVTLRRVMEVVENDNSSALDLVKALEHDQSLVSRILSMANSAFYNYNRQVKDINSAIMVLGFNMIKNLTISTSLFKMNGAGGNSKELTGLWRHSYEIAIAASMLAERTGLVKKDEAFLAGLINNIGRVILYQLYGKVYIKICAYGREGLVLREEEAFGGNHQEVGAWFVDHYKFPRECVMSIKNHHNPERFISDYKAGTQQIIPIVYLADLIVSGNREGFEFDLAASASHAEIMHSIYIDEDGIEEIKEALLNMEDSISAFYAA